MKHHYLPKFYMKKWTYPKKGEVQCYYAGHNREIRSRSMSLKAIGYKDDLYAREDCDNNQELETDCYQKIDSNAAIAMTKMLAGEKFSDEERCHFSNFVYSLLIRHPSSVEQNVQSALEIIQKMEEGIPERIRREPECQNKLQSMKRNHPFEAMQALSTSNNRYSLEGQDGFSKIFCPLTWRVENFSKEVFSLLSCDSPVIIKNEFGKNRIFSDDKISMAAQLSTKKYLTLIPLSPTDCFLAFPREYGAYVENNVIKNRGNFVKRLNLMIVQGAREFVISKDKKQEEFICKHFRERFRKKVADSRDVTV